MRLEKLGQTDFTKSEKIISRLSVIQGIKNQPIQDLENELVSTSMTLAMLKEADEQDPARPFIGIIQRTGDEKGEIAQLTLHQYRAYMKRAPNPSILTKDGKHVIWEYAMDDMAKTLGFKGNNADDQFRKAIYEAKDRRDKIEQIKYSLAALDRELVDRKVKTPSYEFEQERQKAIDAGADAEQIKEYNSIIAELKSNERHEELQKINSTRTPGAIALDRSILHSKVIGPEDPKTETWEVDPGKYDVNGIDTPDGKTVTVTSEPMKLKGSSKLPKGGKLRRSSGKGHELGGGVVRDRTGQHIRI